QGEHPRPAEHARHAGRAASAGGAGRAGDAATEEVISEPAEDAASLGLMLRSIAARGAYMRLDESGCAAMRLEACGRPHPSRRAHARAVAHSLLVMRAPQDEGGDRPANCSWPFRAPTKNL